MGGTSLQPNVSLAHRASQGAMNLQVTHRPDSNGKSRSGDRRCLNGNRPYLRKWMTSSAFLGTNPTGELITSGLLVTRPQIEQRHQTIEKSSRPKWWNCSWQLKLTR